MKDINEQTDILERCVADEFEIPIAKLKGKCREQELVFIRQAWATQLRNAMKLGWTTIAKLLNKDHATIIHYLRQHSNLYGRYENYTSVYDRLDYRFNNTDDGTTNYWIEKMKRANKKKLDAEKEIKDCTQQLQSLITASHE